MQDKTITAFNKTYTVTYEYPLSGQKKVYKVEEGGTKNIYILKMVPFVNLGDVERSYREANILKSIKSEYFPKVYEIDLSLENKVFYVLEEYIEGDNLSILKENYKEKEQKVIKLLIQLVEGLQILWEQEIVHRDLKPENIIIRKNGDPVILDLGIAKILNTQSLTQNTRMPYSNHYLAPEQYKNETHLISMRTDFFTLGIVCYELITGKHPFDMGKSEEINLNIVNCDFEKIMNNTKLNLLFEKMLAKKQFERFRNYKIMNNFIKENWGEVLCQ